MRTAGELKSFDAEWRARFERFARNHEDEAGVSGWSSVGLRRRLALFFSVLATLDLPQGGTALDLGCGAGTYVRLLADHGHRVIGVDYSLPTLGRAQAVDSGAAGRYLCADCYDLPFAKEAFDLVVCIGVLQAVGQPMAILTEIQRVLRPGGVLVVEALNGRALATIAADLGRRFRRLPVRVRAYPPALVRGWLAAPGFQLDTRESLWLPPRRFPRLASLLDSRVVSGIVQAAPWLATALAHSFLFIARKAPFRARSDRPEGRGLGLARSRHGG